MSGSDSTDDAMRRALLLEGGRELQGAFAARPRLREDARRALSDDRPELAILIVLASVGVGTGEPDAAAYDVLADAMAANRLAAAYPAHGGDTLDVAWSPEGMLLASAGADGEGVVWDFAGRAEVARLKGHKGRIRSIAFNPVEPLILTACDDGTVRLWNAADGRQTAQLGGYQTAALAARFSPRGQVFVVAADAGRAAIVSNSGVEISRLEGHDGLVLYDAVFSPDGRRVLTAGDDGAACVFDTASGERQVKLVLDGAARSVCFSGDGASFAVAGYDGRVRVASAADGRVQHDLPSPGGRAYFVAFTPDGDWLACAGADGALGCWRYDAELGATRHVTLSGPGSQITRLATTRVNGAATVLAARRDGVLSSYKLNDAEALEARRFQCGGPAWSVAAHPRGSHAAVADGDGQVRVWSLAEEAFDADETDIFAAAARWAQRAGLAFSDDELDRFELDERFRRPWISPPRGG